jgi:hypothetical protein
MRSVRMRAALAVAAFVGCVAAGTSQTADDEFVGGFFPYRKFDTLPATRIDVGGGVLQVAFAPGTLDLSQQTILDWVTRSVRAVAGYYGRLPDPHSRLLIVPIDGRGVRGGTTFGYNGAASRILIGRESTEQHLARDWVLVHELVHHGMPNLADEHHWMEEGLATYVEPIARAQAGELSVQTVWGDLVDGLPKGLPQAGDRGLDRTPTWGRTYWGGALFYLLADIDIRRRTNNTHGLQDAMRELVAEGGNITESWPVDRVIAIADRGSGTRALTELYDRMKASPVEVDLPALWRELGVSVADGRVSFDDAAPLAAIRRAITAPR